MMVLLNKTNIILAVSLCVLFFSCVNKKINFSSLEKKGGKYYDRITGKLYNGDCYDNGRLEGKIVNGLQDGFWKYYFPNQNKIYKSEEYIMGEKSGKEVLFNDVGDTISVTTYKGNLKNGLSIFYGGKKNIRYYENYVDGLREGEYILYYENGSTVKEKGRFKKDMPSGEWHYYDSLGNLTSIEIR